MVHNICIYKVIFLTEVHTENENYCNFCLIIGESSRSGACYPLVPYSFRVSTIKMHSQYH